MITSHDRGAVILKRLRCHILPTISIKLDIYMRLPLTLPITLSFIMTIKREAISFSSDFDESPTKKVKSESKCDVQASPEKWTDDQIKLLCSLRLKGISWEYVFLCAFLTCRDIMSYFPDRTKKAIVRAWERKGREAQEVFTPEIVPPSGELD
jgi:hypothetical protein